VVDATGTTVDNEAELMAASARLSWPLARGYLAVSVQDLMAADTPETRTCRHARSCLSPSWTYKVGPTVGPTMPANCPEREAPSRLRI
jgi:hypothetical protein